MKGGRRMNANTVQVQEFLREFAKKEKESILNKVGMRVDSKIFLEYVYNEFVEKMFDDLDFEYINDCIAKIIIDDYLYIVNTRLLEFKKDDVVVRLDLVNNEVRYLDLIEFFEKLIYHYYDIAVKEKTLEEETFTSYSFYYDDCSTFILQEFEFNNKKYYVVCDIVWENCDDRIFEDYGKAKEYFDKVVEDYAIYETEFCIEECLEKTDVLSIALDPDAPVYTYSIKNLIDCKRFEDYIEDYASLNDYEIECEKILEESDDNATVVLYKITAGPYTYLKLKIKYIGPYGWPTTMTYLFKEDAEEELIEVIKELKEMNKLEALALNAI